MQPTSYLAVPLLLAGLSAACAESPIPTPSSTQQSAPPAGPPTASSGICTANAVGGSVFERTSQGTEPVADAFVMLYEVFHDGGEQWEGGMEQVTGTFTNQAGRYSVCLPVPRGNTGATEPRGRAFQVEVRKPDYRRAGQSFTAVYSVWDYVFVEVNLELVPAPGH